MESSEIMRIYSLLGGSTEETMLDTCSPSWSGSREKIVKPLGLHKIGRWVVMYRDAQKAMSNLAAVIRLWPGRGNTRAKAERISNRETREK